MVNVPTAVCLVVRLISAVFVCVCRIKKRHHLHVTLRVLMLQTGPPMNQYADNLVCLNAADSSSPCFVQGKRLCGETLLNPYLLLLYSTTDAFNSTPSEFMQLLFFNLHSSFRVQIKCTKEQDFFSDFQLILKRQRLLEIQMHVYQGCPDQLVIFIVRCFIVR